MLLLLLLLILLLWIEWNHLAEMGHNDNDNNVPITALQTESEWMVG